MLKLIQAFLNNLINFKIESCPNGHNPNRVTTSYSLAGENIYWTWSTGGDVALSNEAPVKAWYDEVAEFYFNIMN